jgi:hypothetical protein
MTMRTLRVVLALFLVIGTACATSGRTAAPRRDSELITIEELTATEAATMHQVIQRLRPNWLRSRGQVSIQSPAAGNPVVYIDDTRMGGVESLHSIIPSEVQEVRHLNAADATNRFGTGHAGGAIIVRRRTGR